MFLCLADFELRMYLLILWPNSFLSLFMYLSKVPSTFEAEQLAQERKKHKDAVCSF